MKISFDFDSTLTQKNIQALAKILADAGHEIWITSSRMIDTLGQPHWNDDLKTIASELNITIDRIQLTNGQDKWKFLNDFDFHIDDDPDEAIIANINNIKCKFIIVRTDD